MTREEIKDVLSMVAWAFGSVVFAWLLIVALKAFAT